MLSQSYTKLGVQELFILMEKSTCPEVSSEVEKNLKELLKEKCPIIHKHQLDEWCKRLDEYKLDDARGWKVVSEKILLTRSFSFFRNLQEDEEDEKS